MASALAVGTRLGPYEVVAPLGAGGMGEVYRARDQRLGRDVAVKVLPSLYSTDPDRLRRFEQEARAASALNHPGILTIHDFGNHHGAPFVVSELLEGQTLRERVDSGPLPTRKALDYAVQIARGLAAAHDKGIVHRDLKPENVFVTADGRVKILDFGLAKLVRDELSNAPGDAPTVGTAPGTVLGTVGYMSPEQVRGLPADHRSDLFSFGAMLYEMLTGERAFQGGSSVETLHAILTEEPRQLWERSTRIPPALARVVAHCLEKDPQHRFESARDVAFHLESLSDLPGTTMAVAERQGERRRWLAWSLVAVIMMSAAAAGGYALGTLRRAPPAAAMVSVDRLTDFAGLEEAPAVSPDGKSVAFTAYVAGKRQIWVKLLAGGTALQITRGDADHEVPRWAPDGASLVYFTPSVDGTAQGALWEVAALGGSPRRIAASIGGADVSHDGTRLAFFRVESGRVALVTTGRDGGDPRVIAQLPLGSYYLSPRWSPDDQTIAYQSGYIFVHDIFAVSVSGGAPRRMTQEGRILAGFCWKQDGRGIVYSSAHGSTVVYLPTFNLWTVDTDGKEPRQLTFGETSYVEPDLRPNGGLVASRIRRVLDIWKFPAEGRATENASRGTRLTQQTGQVLTPSVAHNDRQVVYLSDSGGHGNLWVLDTETGATRQITYERSPDVGVGVPVWSPDGQHIVFYQLRAGQGGNWLVRPDGSNLHQLITNGGWASWSADSRWVYFNEGTTGTGPLRKIPVDGGPSVLVRSENATRSAVTPDGGTLYYVIERPAVTGGSDYEVRVASPETAPSRVLATIPARRIPSWQFIHPVISPDGKWLALPLTDGLTTNIWKLSTVDGTFSQVTDFGQRATYVARRVSWSGDGKAIFAALGEGDADIVLLRGVTP